MPTKRAAVRVREQGGDMMARDDTSSRASPASEPIHHARAHCRVARTAVKQPELQFYERGSCTVYTRVYVCVYVCVCAVAARAPDTLGHVRRDRWEACIIIYGRHRKP